MDLGGSTIAIIGLGYVGLPLAVEFGKTRPVVGFDISPTRIAELRAGEDRTLEVGAGELAAATQLVYSSDPEDLKRCTVFIVTVPTPVDKAKRPDLTPVRGATRTVAKALKAGDVVIYESTVYPGCTREVCVPILEDETGLVFNRDFFIGYSPERINPGDKAHRLTTITKVTSGSTPEAADAVDALYASIVTAGTYKASSIEVAEAAKVIENTQRDINIALMNELAILFGRMGLDTLEVLAAAGTKWNFLPFRPGLVGGHCIGVDPHYLTYKAQELDYHPEIILAGRRINDGMGGYVASRVVRLMARAGAPIAGGKVLVLGLTFKENCRDLRNSRVIDVIAELKEYGLAVDVADPWVEPGEARHEFGFDLVAEPASGAYDAVVLAVGHREYAAMGAAGIRSFAKDGGVFFDVKGVFAKDESDGRL